MRRRATSQFASGRAKPLNAGLASAVNAAVNENPAKHCLSLLCRMPIDQHRDWICAPPHPGSSD
jgi:hypothetical protein